MVDTRSDKTTFAGGDVIAYRAPLGTADPGGTGTLTAPWLCLGWIDTSGVTFKLAEAQKDLMAAGSLDPIRTITTSAPKTFDFSLTEPMNPAVRSLMDDVDISVLQPATGTTIARYVFPEIPVNAEYAFVFDAMDGDRFVRDFAPQGKVTTRGNDQRQMSDFEVVPMTITCYPALVGGVRTAVVRYLDYGDSIDLTPFYTS